MKTIGEIKTGLEQVKGRSAWRRGVIEYAWMLFDNIEQHYDYLGLNSDERLSRQELKKYMLNGAIDWKEYSEGGSALIYDGDIAKMLCNPTELKKTDSGRCQPNKRESWLDVQARALYQACDLILSIASGEGVQA